MIDISYFVKCALIGSRSYIVSCISEQKNHASYYQQCFEKQYALSESMTYRVFYVEYARWNLVKVWIYRRSQSFTYTSIFDRGYWLKGLYIICVCAGFTFHNFQWRFQPFWWRQAPFVWMCRPQKIVQGVSFPFPEFLR